MGFKEKPQEGLSKGIPNGAPPEGHPTVTQKEPATRTDEDDHEDNYETKMALEQMIRSRMCCRRAAYLEVNPSRTMAYKT